MCVLRGGGHLVHLWPGSFFLPSLTTQARQSQLFLLPACTLTWHCPLSVTATGLGKGRQGGVSPGGVTLAGCRETSAHHPSCVQCERTDTSNQVINEFRSGEPHLCP